MSCALVRSEGGGDLVARPGDSVSPKYVRMCVRMYVRMCVCAYVCRLSQYSRMLDKSVLKPEA
jgi:hypothetical protein